MIENNISQLITELESYKSDVDSLKKDCAALVAKYYNDKKLLILLEEINDLDDVYYKMFFKLNELQDEISSLKLNLSKGIIDSLDDDDLEDLLNNGLSADDPCVIKDTE